MNTPRRSVKNVGSWSYVYCYHSSKLQIGLMKHGATEMRINIQKLYTHHPLHSRAPPLRTAGCQMCEPRWLARASQAHGTGAALQTRTNCRTQPHCCPVRHCLELRSTCCQWLCTSKQSSCCPALQRCGLLMLEPQAGAASSNRPVLSIRGVRLHAQHPVDPEVAEGVVRACRRVGGVGQRFIDAHRRLLAHLLEELRHDGQVRRLRNAEWSGRSSERVAARR